MKAAATASRKLHPQADYAMARITDKHQEAPDVFTYRLRFEDAALAAAFAFAGGQFNMLYIFGVGEVPISIVSDPDDSHILDHTIRIVGRVTEVIGRMQVGEMMGVRGPFGRGWPLVESRGKDVIVITGGLGCAPVVGAIEYMFRRRSDYEHITILHGVKTPRDLLYRERFEQWRQHPDTTVLLTSDQPERHWHNHVGVVTKLFDEITVRQQRTAVMMCGPEIMMLMAARHLIGCCVEAKHIWLSMERNMQCGIGLCGHCQIGPYFACKDGPVMRYDRVAPFLGAGK